VKLMRHIAIVEHRERAAHMRTAVHVVVAFVGAALYVAGGWLVMMHLLGDGDMKSASPADDLSHGEGIAITVSVIDGPTLHCATAPNRVASDTIEITANEVMEVIKELGCWEPSDS
jgi:hypothetical protein